jgi:hypothetical protein
MYPVDAVKLFIWEGKVRTLDYYKNHSHPLKDRQRAKRAYRLLSKLKVKYATRDCTALEHVAHGKRQMIFAFRGTAIAPDYLVDAQLTANAKSIKRLHEARAFVIRVLRRIPTPNKDLSFHGHSLGRFVFVF